MIQISLQPKYVRDGINQSSESIAQNTICFKFKIVQKAFFF